MSSKKIELDHKDIVHDSSIDYYGKRLATASSDSTVKIISIGGPSAPSQLLATLTGHCGPVWRVGWAHPAHSKYGSILASCGYDGRVIVWKEGVAGQWSLAHVFGNHKSSVNSIAWAPYELGLCLACGSSDGSISVMTMRPDGGWDTATIERAHSVGVTAVSWAPATALGSMVGADQLVHKLVSGGFDSVVKVWQFVNSGWKLESALVSEMHTECVRDVSWAPILGLTKSTIASASQDGKVVIWTKGKGGNKWEGKVMHDFEAPVWRVSWSLTGNILSVAAAEGDITLWKEASEGQWESLQWKQADEPQEQASDEPREQAPEVEQLLGWVPIVASPIAGQCRRPWLAHAPTSPDASALSPRRSSPPLSLSLSLSLASYDVAGVRIFHLLVLSPDRRSPDLTSPLPHPTPPTPPPCSCAATGNPREVASSVTARTRPATSSTTGNPRLVSPRKRPLPEINNVSARPLAAGSSLLASPSACAALGSPPLLDPRSWWSSWKEPKQTGPKITGSPKIFHPYFEVAAASWLAVGKARCLATRLVSTTLSGGNLTRRSTWNELDREKGMRRRNPGKARGPPVQRQPLKHRDYEVDLESRLGKTQVVTPIAPLSQQAGYYCSVCECVVKDSANYLDHINGKKHQRALGMSMRVERASLEQVQKRFESLKKRKDPGSFTEQDLDERILKQEQEEEEKKRQRREKKKEKKKEQAGQNETEDMDPDVAAMMGFGGFSTSKK